MWAKKYSELINSLLTVDRVVHVLILVSSLKIEHDVTRVVELQSDVKDSVWSFAFCGVSKEYSRLRYANMIYVTLMRNHVAFARCVYASLRSPAVLHE